MNVKAGNDVVSTESYVEQYAREHKLGKYAEQKTGIPAESAEKAEMGIPEQQKEVKKDVKDTRGKGHNAQAETD